MTVWPASRTLRAGVSALALVTLLSMMPGCAADTVEPASDVEISVLYALSAEAGTLTPIDGTTTRYTLTLSAADAHTIWFSDRPAHLSGTMSTIDFVDDWASFGFAADPPNVAIVLHSAANETDTLLAELTEPTFDAATKTFTATIKVQDEETNSAGKEQFEQFATAADPSLPGSFDGVSVFINDIAGQVKDGCIVAPHITC